MSRIAASLLSLGLVLVGACNDPDTTSNSAAVSSLSPTPAAAPASMPLPRVPGEGLIVDVAGVATFRSLDGTQQVSLPGFRLEGGIVTGSRTWLLAHDGSTWRVDVQSRRLVRSPLGYAAMDGLSLLRGLPRAERAGSWRFALPGPHGALLAQWSGECEVPTVYVIERGRGPRQVSPPGQHLNAEARGWTRSGLPVVEFPEAPCGQGLRGPGLYLETAPGHYRLLVHAASAAYYRLPPTT